MASNKVVKCKGDTILSQWRTTCRVAYPNKQWFLLTLKTFFCLYKGLLAVRYFAGAVIVSWALSVWLFGLCAYPTLVLGGLFYTLVMLLIVPSVSRKSYQYLILYTPVLIGGSLLFALALYWYWIVSGAIIGVIALVNGGCTLRELSRRSILRALYAFGLMYIDMLPITLLGIALMYVLALFFPYCMLTTMIFPLYNVIYTNIYFYLLYENFDRYYL